MRLLRMTTRDWMVIIAVLAILAGTVSGIWRIVRLRKAYQSLARKHWHANINYDEVDDPDPAINPEGHRIYEYHARMRRYHNQLREKYQLASTRPWLPVDPDPPQPVPP
ncbi:MAG: hypothetical protein ACHRXM_03000 [Isosphaerales bacterium]